MDAPCDFGIVEIACDSMAIVGFVSHVSLVLNRRHGGVKRKIHRIERI